MEIRRALARIGLTEGEIQVYEALIEIGLTSTGAVTKKANIASSKVYEVLQRLQNKGLVSHVVKNGVRYYDATPPERLMDFLDEKKSELDEAKDEIAKIIPTIQKRRNTVTRNETIVYTGAEGAKIVLKELLEAGKRGATVYGFGTDTDPYLTHLPKALHNYIDDAKKYKFVTKLIFAKGFTSPNTTATIRYLPKEYLPPVRTMIWLDKVAIVDFTPPITTILIENDKVAASYKQHFDMLWKIAKEK